MEPQNQGFDETKTLGASEDNMKWRTTQIVIFQTRWIFV